MAIQDEITALRRLMESVNKLSASNSASVGKLTTDQLELRHALAATNLVADRALTMCNDLLKRVIELEKS